eukprot:672553-Prorocentrum_minimum.AAC.1
MEPRSDVANGEHSEERDRQRRRERETPAAHYATLATVPQCPAEAPAASEPPAPDHCKTIP